MRRLIATRRRKLRPGAPSERPIGRAAASTRGDTADGEGQPGSRNGALASPSDAQAGLIPAGVTVAGGDVEALAAGSGVAVAAGASPGGRREGATEVVVGSRRTDSLAQGGGADPEVSVDRSLRSIILVGKDSAIQGYNLRAAELLAAKRGRPVAVGDSLLASFDSDDGSFAADLAVALDGGSVRHERVLRDVDGGTSWFDVQCDPVWGETGEIVGACVSFWPIDDRKKSEAALARLAAIVESSDDAITSETLDGIVLSWNPGAERLYGYAAREIEGQSTAILVPAERERELLEILARLRRGERIEPFETVRVRRDGQPIHVSLAISPIRDASGAIIGASTIARDVSARKQAEAQLREREQQYRSIFEATSDGLIIQDLQTGIVVGANPAACRMHGYTREEFVGLHPTTWVHPDDHDLIQEYARAVRAGGQFRGRRLHVRKDGSPLHVEVLGTTFTYLGKPHILCVVRDVSDQVRAREMLEQRVEERTRELSTLLAVSASVASTLELRPLLGVILDQLKAMVDYTSAAICSLRDDELTVLDYRGPFLREQVVHHRWPLAAAELAREVVRRREPLIIFDLQDDAVPGPEASSTTRDYLWKIVGESLSWMGVPLIVKEQVIGLVSLSHQDVNHYHPRHARLAMTIANQAAVAIENARLHEQALALAAIEERQRLARDLHDSVSQALYGIVLGVRTARTLLDRDPPRVIEPLDYVLSLAEAALAEMRTLIFELRPESLATVGLVAALTKRAASIRTRHSLNVRTDFCDEPPVSLDVKEAVYRIVQEALNNVIKHARATRVDLRLTYSPGELVLEVEDDGAGFDPARPFAGHLGLRSMRERAAHLNGTLQIDSAPGRGTRVAARIPVWPDES